MPKATPNLFFDEVMQSHKHRVNRSPIVLTQPQLTTPGKKVQNSFGTVGMLRTHQMIV